MTELTDAERQAALQQLATVTLENTGSLVWPYHASVALCAALLSPVLCTMTAPPARTLLKTLLQFGRAFSQVSD